MSGIFWLASYPKSGNTWLRILLTNHHRDASDPADINHLEHGYSVASRDRFEQLLGIPSSDLTHDEIDALRSEAYREWAGRSEAPILLKVHDAYTFRDSGEPVLPRDVTLGAIYIVRNPIDVAVSAASYFRASPAELVRSMGEAFTACDRIDGLSTQLRQRVLSWSGHVQSWLDSASGFPVLLVRYEDLHDDTFATFCRVLSFLGWSTEEERVRKAIEFSRFDTLQNQERANGFREAPSSDVPFFVRGRPGGGGEILSPAERAHIVRDHGATMARLGYVDGAAMTMSDEEYHAV